MQTFRIDLPEHPDQPGDPQWAEIRAVSTLRSGDRKAVQGAVTMAVDDDGKLERRFSHADVWTRKNVLLRRVIVAWSLPVHPAADPDILDDLPIPMYDALIDATVEHLEALDFKDRPAKPANSESAPPEGSSDSRTTSEASGSPGTSPTGT